MDEHEYKTLDEAFEFLRDHERERIEAAVAGELEARYFLVGFLHGATGISHLDASKVLDDRLGIEWDEDDAVQLERGE